MSRASLNQAAKNRQAVVASTSRLIRQRGIDGVGVRELMAAAGLTQGAFSGQFGSKEALAAEACLLAFAGAEQALVAALDGDAGGQARRAADYYLSAKPPELSCPMTTLSADSARSPAEGPFRQAFTHGLGCLARVIANDPPSADRLVLLAAMVGAAILRNASDDDTPADRIEAAGTGFSQTIA